MQGPPYEGWFKSDLSLLDLAVSCCIAFMLTGCGTSYAAISPANSTAVAESGLSGTGASPALSAFYCSPGAVLGAATVTCTVKLTAASADTTVVSLSNNNAAVTMPATVTMPANTTALQFPVSVVSVQTLQQATLTASAGGVTSNATLTLNPAIRALGVSTTSLAFGAVSLNTAAIQSVTVTSTGTLPLTISAATFTGAGFSVSGVTFPLVLNKGQATVLMVQFNPAVSGTVSGQLTLVSDALAGSKVINLTGIGGAPTLSAFYCASAAVLGSVTDICTVKLNVALLTSGTTVSLSSNNTSVSVPATVTIPANVTAFQFPASVLAVKTVQSVTLTAATGGSTVSFALRLNAATGTLGTSSASLSFANVTINTTATQTMTLASTGTGPVTISGASLTGTGFSLSGASFPMVLNAGQTATISASFHPSVVGASTGQVTLTSDSSSGPAMVSLSGTGTGAALSAFYCSSGAMLGAGTDICTVKLAAASPTIATVVNLSSNNAAVTVPATVTMPANVAALQFTALASSVPTLQQVTLTAIAGGVTINFALRLNPVARTLGVNRTGIAFSDVAVKTTATQSMTLASTGAQPVTISAASLTNAAFSIGGAAFPLTLNPGQAVPLMVQFYPTVIGSTTGLLTLTSDSSAGPVLISLSGTSVRGPNTTAMSQGYFAYGGSTLVTSLTATNPSTAISNNLFGMTAVNLAPNSLYAQPGMTPFPALPVSTFRFWDVAYWAMMEPQQGVFNWTKMDNTLSIAQQNGATDFIYTFGHVPAWASTNPADPCTNGEGAGTCTAPDMTSFDDFATKVVQRYCGKVKLYEPWNEPDGPAFWDGTNLQMLTITQHVSRIVKDPANCGCTNGSCSPNGGVNPNQVLLSPISNLSPVSIGWLDTYLAAAGTNYPYADIAAFHGYIWSGYQPEQIVSGIQVLKQTLAKYGMSNLELWNTEVSWQYNTNLTAPQQTSWMMRYHAAQATAGVSRVLWYAYDQCGWGTLWASPLCPAGPDPVGQLREPGVAYGTVANWLIGANLTHCQQYQDGLWACELQRSGGYDAWMLWSTTGTSLSVPVPANLALTTYRDWQNQVNPLPTQITVTSSPILLEQ